MMIRLVFLGKIFSDTQNKQAWGNILVKGLDTKVQAFNFKMVNNLLPIYSMIGGNEKHCRYCRKKYGTNNEETLDHLFIDCGVASMVWGKINMKLRRQGMVGIDTERGTIIYKLGLSKDIALLVSEVNWALWKNRNNNSREVASLGGALVVRCMFVKRIEKLMRIDRVLLSGAKFRGRWGVVEEIMRLISVV